MFLFQVLNQLVVDVLVGIILACLKAIANIEEKSNPNSGNPARNIYSQHNYNHWERTILWLEDITEANFSYLPDQVRFISLLIGVFYGVSTGLIITLGNLFLRFDVSGEEIILISLVLGGALGIAGSRSLTSRPSIFDISNDEFKGDFFDR
jgi:hypothetical protein